MYVCWTPDVIPDLIKHLTGHILYCVLSTLLFIYFIYAFLFRYIYIFFICSHVICTWTFLFILIHSLGVLTPWICISSFVAIYYWSGFFGEDHMHLEESEFSLTWSSFLGIFCFFFILSLSCFYALDSYLFHFLFICYHVWMFIWHCSDIDLL